MQLELGETVRCSDDVAGEVLDVVIDPTTKRLTHLVVELKHGGLARLVPVELAGSAEGEREIVLGCTVAEVQELPSVQDFAYLRLGSGLVDDPEWDVGVREVLAMPFFETDGIGDYSYADEVGVTYDRIPKGEVEVRRMSAVESADGHRLGHVDGFLLDDGQHITDIVLQRGHLWGKRDVTIPIGSVAEVRTDTVIVELSRDEVGALPAKRVHRWLG
jgi:sporulation protein YlmC with PRC-barrel domain